MEILLVRCLSPECRHVESDSSLEAAKYRLVKHLRQEHHLHFVLVPPGEIKPEDWERIIAESVAWDGAWAPGQEEAAHG